MRSLSLSLLLALCASPCAAQAVRHDALSNVTVSYFEPTRASRQIRTVFLDFVAGYEILELLGIDVYAGLSLALASGNIVQPDDALHDVRYDASVIGAGPTFLFRVEPLRIEGFALAADAVGSILFYSAHFPPGGDVYDFAWRVGGTLSYALTPRFRLELACRWMHVSNGQGIGAFNPAYEGVGAYLGSQIRL